jgi:hypothetical protein
MNHYSDYHGSPKQLCVAFATLQNIKESLNASTFPLAIMSQGFDNHPKKLGVSQFGLLR